MVNVCEIIKTFILENNVSDGDFVFRVIDFDNNYIDIEPSNTLEIEYDEENMDFYDNGEKIGSMSVGDLNCVFIEDKIEDE